MTSVRTVTSSTRAAASSSSRGPDKRVVLFGKTGEGKSTIANVLVAGGLEPVIFESSDAARGCTSDIKKFSGRGWAVTDTVGLGEAEMGNTSHQDAKSLLVGFLKDVQDSYSHIIYVQKARRITTMEEMIWKIFANIFKGAEESFVVLITAASQQWYEENKSKFPEYWKDVEILFTDIPPVHKRPVLEKRLKARRHESIEKLEADLNALFEKKGRKYFTPDITKMNDEELEKKSWSLLEYIVTQIKKLFDKSQWQNVARSISTVIKFTSYIVDKILLMDAVK